MGGVGFSGIMPWDVAKLTDWQVVEDFHKPRAELLKRIHQKREQSGQPADELPNLLAMDLPTREQYFEGLRINEPELTADEMNRRYDELARQWNEEGE